MSRAFEFFRRYIAVDTTSSETSGTHPSSPGQFELGKILVRELQKLGAADAAMSEHAYVMGHIPATPGCEKVPALGLIAHMDTSCAASGAGVKASVIDYQGGPVSLGSSGRILVPGDRFIGHKLAVTDGTTLLGADDKAGIASIMALLDELRTRDLPHGKLCICFTPDEEIGEGTDFFDIEQFGARYAFTVDGGAPEEVEFQNFNAAGARILFHGLSCHPGSARDLMINASRIAMEFDAMLPAGEVPEKTAGFEGFFHLYHMEGNVSLAESEYLIRDHDAAGFARRKACMQEIAEALNRKYPAGTVELILTDQYRNMAEIVNRSPELIAMAEKAVRLAGLTPVFPPIRGGTDGAKLSFMGLPCPNLGAGAHCCHGELEFLSLDQLEQSVEILLHLTCLCMEQADC